MTEPIKVVAMALQAQLGLDEKHIMLGLENWSIPNDKGLYVSLLYGPEQIVSNTQQNSVDSNDAYVEVQSSVMLHTIEVDIMSYDSSARTNKEQVLWACTSYQAKQLMGQYQMKLWGMPSVMIPVGSLEPAKQLNRFRFSITIQALHQNEQVTPYYDTITKVGLTENA
jgi:hypothetical protein